MRSEIVDTNVIIRFLRADNLEQFNQAKNWFKLAQQGKKKLIIKPIVIAEASYVLESFYGVSRSEIASSLQSLIKPKWLQVEDRKILINLWDHYLDNLHFIDSFLLTCAEIQQGQILTFDKQLIKKQ